MIFLLTLIHCDSYIHIHSFRTVIHFSVKTPILDILILIQRLIYMIYNCKNNGEIVPFPHPTPHPYPLSMLWLPTKNISPHLVHYIVGCIDEVYVNDVVTVIYQPSYYAKLSCSGALYLIFSLHKNYNCKNTTGIQDLQ